MYPCPYCLSPAALDTGCTGCHRPPDPEAAEVIRLDGTIRVLAAEVDSTRRAHAAARERYEAVRLERNALAARVHARVRASMTPAGPVPSAPLAAEPALAVDPASPPREASTRTVQNVLFVLGGLLLGSAAIVFTAVAWANFGVSGRAAILATVTVLALAVGPVARRRRLDGTAETFAALGLLLVLLDGYAAWYVNLAGLAHSVRPTAYAALVCTVAAGIATGYATATGLRGPRYAAVVVAQPVVPLLAAWLGVGPAGWAGALVLVALADLAVVRLAGRVPDLVVPGWALHGLAMAGAVGAALVAITTAGSTASAARAGGALVAVAATALVASLVTPAPAVLRHAAAGAVTATAGVAAARVLAAAWPGLTPVLVPATAAGLALLTLALPARVRRGPATVAAGFAALAGLVPLAGALSGGVSTAGRAFPAWHATLAAVPPLYDWQLPAGLALVALGLAVALPRQGLGHVTVAAATLLALAVPACYPAAWWAPSTVDGVVLVPLLILAVTRLRAPLCWTAAAGAGGLAAHAVVAGLARPASTAVVLAALIALAGAAATLARRTPPATAIGASAVLVGLTAVPGLAAALAASAGGTGPAIRGWAAAGLVLAGAVAVAVSRRVPGYALAAATAVGLAGAGATVFALPDRWLGTYAAVAVLLDVVAFRAALRAVSTDAYDLGLGTGIGLTGATAIPAVVTAVPATWAVLVEPYGWLGAIWQGRPSGATPHAGASAALALAGLTVAVALTGRWARSRGWVAVPALPAALVGATALGAPWPAVPALSLSIAVAAALGGALTTRVSATPPALVAGLAGGAGLAGLLPTRASTIAGLGVAVVAAAVCGAAGRRAGARLAGWLVAVPAAAVLALAATLAGGAAVRVAAFAVLGAGALAMGTAAALRTRPVEARVVETAAHAVAAVALLMTAGSLVYAAAVSTLWGLVLGVRALWPAGPAQPRRIRVVAACGCELLAYWLVLVNQQVTVLEAYTVPLAGAALLAGWLAVRGRPGLRSWSAYAPALLAGFAPSLAAVLVAPGYPLRRLALGVAAVAVVLAGSARRRQAPVVVGGAVLALLALHEVALRWDLLPRWIPLAVAGLLLVGTAMTYERRRRDLGRLRAAVGRMR